MNTQEIKALLNTLPLTDNFLYTNDNFCIVDLDYLTNRDYQNQGINELFFTLGQHSNKIFVFLCRDGVNCNFTGLKQVIEALVQNYNLTQQNCFIYGYENLNIANTTYVEFDLIEMWCSQIYKYVEPLPLSSNCFSKKFAALFGRHDLYRLKFFRHLCDHYQNDSVLSYNSVYAQWNHRFVDKYFSDDKLWFAENCPKLLDFETSRGWVPFQESLKCIGAHYQSYFLELVCETDVYSNKFFTEKTLKNFYLGKTFLLFSGYQSLERLKQKGFKTFGPYIDESYDNIKCPYSRYTAIIKEIDRLATLPYTDLNQIAQQLQPVFEHNRQNFLKICLTD
jgi:hypothetical protein